jgi:hypothetical protein
VLSAINFLFGSIRDSRIQLLAPVSRSLIRCLLHCFDGDLQASVKPLLNLLLQQPSPLDMLKPLSQSSDKDSKSRHQSVASHFRAELAANADAVLSRAARLAIADVVLLPQKYSSSERIASKYELASELNVNDLLDCLQIHICDLFDSDPTLVNRSAPELYRLPSVGVSIQFYTPITEVIDA